MKTIQVGIRHFEEYKATAPTAADGFYKITKNTKGQKTIFLYKRYRELFAAIYKNKYGSGIVNAGRIHGKLFFQHALSDHLRVWLGISESNGASTALAEDIIFKLFYANGDKELMEGM